MTEQEMRIAVAESVGWVKALDFNNPSSSYYHSWRNPKTGMMQSETPNYPSDLNEMHEVWNTLNRKERISFSQSLRKVVIKAGGHAASFNEDIIACVENATAHQRCEAYLRVKGLWRDLSTGHTKPSPTSNGCEEKSHNNFYA